MLLNVETRPGLHGDKEPIAFMLGDRRIEVVEILDRWMGVDHSDFNIQASEQATYSLRCEPLLNRWQLALFQAQF